MKNTDLENKYYTPAIEEFHVGFEYEVRETRYSYEVQHLEDNKFKVLSEPKQVSDWYKEVYKLDSFMYSLEDEIFDNLSAYVENKTVRVKYLDKEDIESFGFINTKNYSSGSNYQKIVDGYLFYEITNEEWGDETILTIERFYQSKLIAKPINEHNSVTIFQGTIKNKSELKVLLKQLGIDG